MMVDYTDHCWDVDGTSGTNCGGGITLTFAFSCPSCSNGGRVSLCASHAPRWNDQTSCGRCDEVLAFSEPVRIKAGVVS